MTQATLSRFQMGPKILLANLRVEQVRAEAGATSEGAAAGQAASPPSPQPCCSGLALATPQHHEVLDHLLAQVVVDAVDLVLTEQGGDVVGEVVRALQVPSKGLLHNDTVPASVGAQSHITPHPP